MSHGHAERRHGQCSHSPRLACECAGGIQSAQAAARARTWWLVVLERCNCMPPRCLQRGKPRRCRAGDREHSTPTVTARAAGGLGLRRSVRHCAGGSTHADPGLILLRTISLPSRGVAGGPGEGLGRRRAAIGELIQQKRYILPHPRLHQTTVGTASRSGSVHVKSHGRLSAFSTDNSHPPATF